MGLTISPNPLGVVQIVGTGVSVQVVNSTPSIDLTVTTGPPGKDGSAGLPSQSGQNGKFLTTNGSILSWATVATGGGSWGSITGALTDQSDLNTALATKATVSEYKTADSGLQDSTDELFAIAVQPAGGPLPARPNARKVAWFVTDQPTESGPEDVMFLIGNPLSVAESVRALCLASDFSTTSTTLAPVTDFTTAAGASEVWLFDAFLVIDASATGDIRLQPFGPSGALMTFGGSGLSTAATAGQTTATPGMVARANINGTDTSNTGTLTFGGTSVTGTPTLLTLRVSGSVRVSTTPGTIGFNVAQATSDGTYPTKVLAGSTITWRKVTT